MAAIADSATAAAAGVGNIIEEKGAWCTASSSMRRTSSNHGADRPRPLGTILYIYL